MKLNLEDLPHQKAALDALLDAFPSVDDAASGNAALCGNANPPLRGAFDESHFIDIKMETGTGKTYVYTRAMYELHRVYGIFKFIIVVPSLAIKEGTRNFITSDYARKHFARLFNGVKLDLLTLNAGDFAAKKGKRKTMPTAISNFVETSNASHSVIECLLLSDKGFLDREGSMLFKDDYDQNLFGGYSCPAEGIKSTLPVVIIDEPHRLKRGGKSYVNMMARLKPQMIMRFGATFADGNDRKKDYYRGKPQYDLCAVDAFNQGLVKGVTVNFPRLHDAKAGLFGVRKCTRDALVLSRKSDKKEWTIARGEDLAKAGAGFEGGVTYEGGELSNGLVLNIGMTLAEGTFTNSYQELLMNVALDCHFRAEEENFCRARDGWRVKTICLFFIDSISSYRDKDGWLKCTFERLLRAKLDSVIESTTDEDYKDYLRATLQDIAACHGGYFAADWGKSDESAVAEEVNDILHKERTLNFKREDGRWNTRRFFFSKWTLREGWDNPNVFTICKLRSSGSETSKVQEVGRGLRLPVDEAGNRLHDNEWRLNFVVGYDEADFAAKLVGEINASAALQLNKEHLTDNMLAAVCKTWGMDSNAVLQRLIAEEKIIDYTHKYIGDGYERLLELCPELMHTQLNSNKVGTSENDDKNRYIYLRKDNWKAIRSLWDVAAKQYMIVLDRSGLGNNEIKDILTRILQTESVFNDNSSVIVEKVSIASTDNEGNDGGNSVSLRSNAQIMRNTSVTEQMKYGAFIKELSLRTDIPLSIIHSCVWQTLQEKAASGIRQDDINRLINRRTLSNILEAWNKTFMQKAAAYTYKSLDFTAAVSVLQDGEFADKIARGAVGRFNCTDAKDDEHNLYDTPLAFDSEHPEHDIIKLGCPPCDGKGAAKIVAFGKLPRRAIRVPLITGGTTTPDFVYALQTDNGEVLYMLVEAKSEYPRDKEKIAIDAQKNFFHDISGDKLRAEWKLATTADDAAIILNRFTRA